MYQVQHLFEPMPQKMKAITETKMCRLYQDIPSKWTNDCLWIILQIIKKICIYFLKTLVYFKSFISPKFQTFIYDPKAALHCILQGASLCRCPRTWLPGGDLEPTSTRKAGRGLRATSGEETVEVLGRGEKKEKRTPQDPNW